MSFQRTTRLILGLAAVGLVGCTTPTVEAPEIRPNTQRERMRNQYGTITGQDGFVLFSNRPSDEAEGTGPGIAVNPYLWRASLETIDFMPLTQADPFGGVIITDWHSPPETPNERFKLNVYILGRALRSDGVKVTVFRQTGGEAGWQDAPADPKTATDIEDAILTRARELRVASLEAAEQ
jgi:Domain of unknown function (DUF3576)